MKSCPGAAFSSDVRGVRGGCDDSGFIWNDDMEACGSNDVGKKLMWLPPPPPPPPPPPAFRWLWLTEDEGDSMCDGLWGFGNEMVDMIDI